MRIVIALIVAVAFSSRGLSMSTEGVNNKVVQSEDTEWGRAIEQQKAPQFCPDLSVEIDEEVDIAIIGGGLVGLSVAIGLSRAGVDCKVYERAPQLRSVSQGMLAVQPNGMGALDTIHPDIPGLVARFGSELQRSHGTMIRANGTVEEKTTEMGKESVEKFGLPLILITWHNMQQLLASLLPPDLVRTSRSLSSFTEKGDHVLIYFEDGTLVRAQAVLACDGVFSAAHRQMFPDDSPIFFGQLNWASIIETSKLPSDLHPPNTVRYISFDGETRWNSYLNDAGSGYSFWQLRVADPEKAMALSGNNGRGGLGLRGVKEALLSVSKANKDVVAAIESTPECQIFERSIVGRRPLSTWLSEGLRVALVGDSAHGMHPNIGQGANSGFESAAAVVNSLVRHKNDKDWRVALNEYQDERKPRADLVQRFANAMGVVQATGKKLLPTPLVKAMTDWIKSNESTVDPPKEAENILANFDPCDEPGVSLLW